MKTWRAQAAGRRAAKKPAVFTIPSDAAFVDTLARGILDDAGEEPLALAAITVLLPTRRACRSLREAFLRLSGGKPLLLPRLMPLNDMDDEEALFASYGVAETALDIPPPMPGLKRQLMLAKMILPIEPQAEQAVRLAQELAKFLDQVQTERLSFDNLKNLAPERFAAHWQQTIAFMEVVTEHWPKILEDAGAIDPATHRNLVFAAQAAAWRKGAASGPVIAAGSTGSIPATADVLAAVARLPEGCVVLPGLDRHLNDAEWAEVDESHPQYGLKHLLTHMDIDRGSVMDWPNVSSAISERARFVSEVMRPARTTDAWQTIAPLSATAVAGLSRIDCPSPREEAEVIALVMREALEEPGRTCALVTPDRDLAERVGAELKRWDIVVDDSAGRPLHQTPPGAFLRLTASMVAEAFAPVPLLAACKHPLAAAGRDPIVFRDLTRQAEIEILRGPRPGEGLDGLRALAESRDVKSWIDGIAKTCGAFAALMAKRESTFLELLTAHMEAAEAFAAAHDTPGPLRLWAGDAGEAAASFVAELAQSAQELPPIPPSLYPGIFEALMESRVVRPRFGSHPRLHILGPLEARLQRFDVLILGGLNEGTWPAAPGADPWMSRPMRKSFGLPLPERRVGQAAHDIVQALCAPRVVLTRANKVEGTPTVPSRWLMRLARVVAAAKLDDISRNAAAPFLHWARTLTKPDAFASVGPPAFNPPGAARPRQLSVTRIETWMRDPYGLYAERILKLKPLAPLEQDVSAAEYGTLIHQTLDDFITQHPSGALPPQALEMLLQMGRAKFTEMAPRPGILAFWGPRFERIAAWFIDTEDKRRHRLAHSYAEVTGQMTIAAPGGLFTVTATADRIDRTKDGRLMIIDYKTGAPPTEKEVAAGYAPQLPLEAAILAAGGFAGVPAGPLDGVSFWQLHGRDDGGRERPVKLDPETMAADARARLEELVATFDDPATAYEARPSPEHAPKYSHYEHLARVREWASDADGGDA
jgi:ATP-dependent helicase/nuclease subunit B